MLWRTVRVARLVLLNESGTQGALVLALLPVGLRCCERALTESGAKIGTLGTAGNNKPPSTAQVYHSRGYSGHELRLLQRHQPSPTVSLLTAQLSSEQLDQAHRAYSSCLVLFQGPVKHLVKDDGSKSSLADRQSDGTVSHCLSGSCQPHGQRTKIVRRAKRTPPGRLWVRSR